MSCHPLSVICHTSMSYCLNLNCTKPQHPSGTRFCITCGRKLLLSDRYRAIQPIGQGGFGKTFLGVDEYQPSQPRCVIKKFYYQGAGSQKAAELFEQEAVRLDELGKHPQIPELLAHFEQDKSNYLVQEFIDGQNLAEELATTGNFDENKVCQLLKELLPILEFIHSLDTPHASTSLRFVKSRGFLVHSPILTEQDCSNPARGLNSLSFRDSVCPTVLSPFCKMFNAALISLSST